MVVKITSNINNLYREMTDRHFGRERVLEKVNFDGFIYMGDNTGDEANMGSGVGWNGKIFNDVGD